MSANDRQEAGSHYRQNNEKLQHWDLAIMFDWDPFQYQITKYVMRWKLKHKTFEGRLTDLKKAQHFLEKYIENAEVYGGDAPPAPGPSSIDIDAALEGAARERFNPLASRDDVRYANEDWQCEGYWGDMTQLYKCRHCHPAYYVRAASLSDATTMHLNCPARTVAPPAPK